MDSQTRKLLDGALNTPNEDLVDHNSANGTGRTPDLSLLKESGKHKKRSKSARGEDYMTERRGEGDLESPAVIDASDSMIELKAWRRQRKSNVVTSLNSNLS